MAGAGTGATLQLDDADAIARLKNVVAAAPSTQLAAQVVAGAANWATQVTGSTPAYFVVQDWRPDERARLQRHGGPGRRPRRPDRPQRRRPSVRRQRSAGRQRPHQGHQLHHHRRHGQARPGLRRGRPRRHHHRAADHRAQAVAGQHLPPLDPGDLGRGRRRRQSDDGQRPHRRAAPPPPPHRQGDARRLHRQQPDRGDRHAVVDHGGDLRCCWRRSARSA